jgi:hypothetical protein|tara:strand:- start:2598 stop:3014 length:417 start_codon:yes stop_codon:yes gene_type:complete
MTHKIEILKQLMHEWYKAYEDKDEDGMESVRMRYEEIVFKKVFDREAQEWNKVEIFYLDSNSSINSREALTEEVKKNPSNPKFNMGKTKKKGQYKSFEKWVNETGAKYFVIKDPNLKSPFIELILLTSKGDKWIVLDI